jgi:hypothetical protein
LWGTVYTAAYYCDSGSVELSWPDDSWTLSVHDFREGVRSRRTLVAVPAEPVPAAAPVPAHGHLSFIM